MACGVCSPARRPRCRGSGDDGLRLQSSATEIGKYQRIDFEVAVPWPYRNPFDLNEVNVTLEIRTPDGERLALPAFWMQGYERQVLQRGSQKDWLYPQGSAGLAGAICSAGRRPV